MTPSSLTAVHARHLIGTGELSSVDLIESCLAQIDAVDHAVNAMVTVVSDRARSEAVIADEATRAGIDLGPLHGIPIAIKDLQDTAQVRTTYGSVDFSDHVPNADSGIVRRIRDAGGIVIAKTNIPEYSIGANTVNRLFGATGNPFAPDLTCGGSSGGSAVAVATEMVPLATGSDHGGSLRIPACYCGVVGHRSTPGIVPNEERAVSQTFYSVQGPLARTVGDVALLLSVIATRPSRDPMSFPLNSSEMSNLDEIDPAALRIGVSEDLGGVLVSDTVRASFAHRMELLSELVGSVESVPVDLRRAPMVDWSLRGDLFVAQWGRDAESWAPEFNPSIQRSYRAAIEASPYDIANARRVQMELCQDFAAIFDDIDVLICPGVSVPPFPWTQMNPSDVDGSPIESYMAWLELTSSLTVVGHPVTALPCGVDGQGTPFGIQVVGPMYSDRRLLSIASSLETMFSSHVALARPRPDLDGLTRARSIN